MSVTKQIVADRPGLLALYTCASAMAYSEIIISLEVVHGGSVRTQTAAALCFQHLLPSVIPAAGPRGKAGTANY